MQILSLSQRSRKNLALCLSDEDADPARENEIRLLFIYNVDYIV